MSRFEGKVALVTGAARGLGACTAKMLAEDGAEVWLCDLLDAEGEAIAAQIRAGGGVAHYVRHDVTQEASWRALTERVAQAGRGLHILINNAGATHRAGLASTSPDDWNRVLAVNLTGPFLGMRACAPLMRQMEGGAIVNVASIAGLIAAPETSYGASKWGLLGLTKSAALELSDDGIRVNAVCPGVIDTPGARTNQVFESVVEHIPLGRRCEPEEVAGLMLFLASDEARYITGEEIAIDGGLVGVGLLRNMRRALARAAAE